MGGAVGRKLPVPRYVIYCVPPILSEADTGVFFRLLAQPPVGSNAQENTSTTALVQRRVNGLRHSRLYGLHVAPKWIKDSATLMDSTEGYDDVGTATS